MANRADRDWSVPDTDRKPGSGRYSLRRGAKALVTAGNRALLVRERHADGTPFWTLPGGGVNDGENPTRAVERELREELRCRTVVVDRVTTYPYVHRTRTDTVSLYAVYACYLLTRPSAVVSEGIRAVTWATPGSPPPRTLPQVRAVLDAVRLAERRDGLAVSDQVS